MDSVFVEQLKRIRHLVVLLLSLDVVALAVAAASGAPLTLLVLLAVLLLATLALLYVLRSRSMTRAASRAQEPLLAIDPNTGIATEYWYRHMLALECRRAVREFAPLTVLSIHLGDQVRRPQLLELVRVLGEAFSRPGDLVGWHGGRVVGAVLPSTNENAQQLVQRCYDRIREHESMAELPLRIVAETFQPLGDLCLAKVHHQLESHLHTALQQEPGVFYYSEFSTHANGPGMTYNDQ
ncbi:nucleotidyl cyclase domain-containing protein [Marinobacterium weihaiense]|uniref:GGDEF domain-containing protein n=1 Tax=Marinobacterium weihaiense TaxID=2851016 RepID=A0ABS6M950_9GAMM|nr:hypothetical protein [Marinobacterium weihaiense]MBV0932821.1 hypothetical protein [Marinobacterium weihaiense]